MVKSFFIFLSFAPLFEKTSQSDVAKYAEVPTKGITGLELEC